MFDEFSSSTPRQKAFSRSTALHRRLLKLSFALATAFFATLAVAATDKSDVMTTVQKFVDSFNKGDVKALSVTCADQASIIDEFPPHQWHGAGACAKWSDAYDAWAKKNGITDGVVTLSAPLHVDVTGDYAYVVVPADYKYKQNGKPVQEIGSALIIALHKDASGWRIAAWAWSKH
jgi:ketosteroid isomerase-like protein